MARCTFLQLKSDLDFTSTTLDVRKAMKKLNIKNAVYISAVLGMVFMMSGCASNGCSPSPFGQFFQDRPIRNSIRSMFVRGDACNTCNPPVGQPHCGTNVAPLCNSCGSAMPGQPIMGQPTAQPVYGNPVGNGVSLYEQPILNAPQQGYLNGDIQPAVTTQPTAVEPGSIPNPPQF